MADAPELPAVPEYPKLGGPHKAAIDAAKEAFLAEVDNTSATDGWEDHGIRDDVQLWRKLDPADPYGLPTVRGTATVEDATTEQILAMLQLPGMRKLWDPRFETGHMIARYSHFSYAFYTEMKGMGWLVWPRDIVGAQENFLHDDLNKEILVIQTSVEEGELAPEVHGKCRAVLTVAGWRIKPVGDNVELTYLVQINLAGSIPATMVQMVATEIPTCVGRVRDVFYQHGHGPFAHNIDENFKDGDLISQTEHFDAESKTWRSIITGKKAGSKIGVIYDAKRMYPGGIKAEAEQDGKDGVSFEDNGTGLLSVTFGEATVGKRVDIVVSPK